MVDNQLFGIKLDELDVNEALKVIPNRFLLVSTVSKRARQLQEGFKPLIEVDVDESTNMIAIALSEIIQGKINVDFISDDQEELDELSEMDRVLDAELEEEAAKEEEEKAKKTKEKKSKSKSKSKSVTA